MARKVVVPEELGAEFDIGNQVADKITMRVDGTSLLRAVDGTLAVAAPVLDNVNKVITFPSSNGAPAQVFDMSEFLTDIKIDGGSYDASTSILKLTDNDGVSPDVVIDLSAVKGVSTDSGNILVNGSDGAPLLTAAVIAMHAGAGVSVDAGNVASVGSDSKVLVSESAVNTLADDRVVAGVGEELQDSFGNAIGFIRI